MVRIILSVLFIAFGIFLKYTKNPGFQASRKFSTFLVILGILTLIGSILLQYTNNPT